MKARVLLIDDSDFIPGLLQKTLEETGWSLVRPGSGAEDADFLLIDPAAGRYEALGRLTEMMVGLPSGEWPILGFLRDTRQATRSCLDAMGIKHAFKDRLLPKRLMTLMAEVQERFRADRTAKAAFSLALEIFRGPWGAQPGTTPEVMAERLLEVLLRCSSLEEAGAALAVFLTEHFPIEDLLLAVFPPAGAPILFSTDGPRGLPDPAKAELRLELSRDLLAGAPVRGLPTAERPPSAERTETILYRFGDSGDRLQVTVSGGQHALTLRRLLEGSSRHLEVFRSLAKLEDRTTRLYRGFSRFLPGEVIEDLLRKSADASLMTGEKRRVVAFFSHIKDFSRFAEENEPSTIVGFLNRHFGLYASIIRKHGGFINKYIGDAVFALFGAPLSHPDNAGRALAAAREILEILERRPLIDPSSANSGYRVGIGLHEGQAIIGNIGSTESFDYTAIGDTVNLASRLESLNKHYGTSLLFSDRFLNALEREGTFVPCRLADIAKVKGKKTATEIYTLAEGAAASGPLLDFYEKGQKMYRIGNWLTALDYFESALEIAPSDTLTLLFRDRCRDYLARPPQDWDGSIELSFK